MESIRFILPAVYFLFTSGCYIDYTKANWDKKTIGSATTSDGKPLTLIQEGKGVSFPSCGGHNPVIYICIYPSKYYIDFVSEGRSYGKLLKPDNIRGLFPVNEQKLLGLQYPDNFPVSWINVIELKPNSDESIILSTIPYTLNSPEGEKQDITISRKGNLLGWAEPTGLTVINLNTGLINKYFKGLPVRLPVFSEDEKKVSFYVWFDTSAAKNLNIYKSMTHLNKFTVIHEGYDKKNDRVIEIERTIEHAGLFALDLKTEKLLPISPGYRLDYPEDICTYPANASEISNCKGKFQSYGYRDHHYGKYKKRSFTIDQNNNIVFK